MKEGIEAVQSRLTFFAELFQVHVAGQQTIGMWKLYALIVVLTIIVFRLGFAQKLKLWHNLLIYTFLILGCTVLTFFAVFLPIAEGLIVAALILIFYRWRRRDDRKEMASK